MKRQIIFIVLICLLVLPTLVNAEVQSLPPVKLDECVNIQQTCSNCTYVKLDSVVYPNSTKLFIDTNMDNDGYGYNYSFCSNDLLGRYIVSTCGDVDGIVTCVNYDYEVTESGKESFSSYTEIALTLLTIIILYILTYLIIYRRDRFIGSIVFVLLGIGTWTLTVLPKWIGFMLFIFGIYTIIDAIIRERQLHAYTNFMREKR